MSTVSIGGVSINPSIMWNKRLSAVGMAQKLVRTVGGRLVVFQQSLQKGEEIDLEATEDTGWIEFSAVNSLISLANAGGVYPLLYRDFSGNVMFRFGGGPAVDMQLLLPSSSPAPDSPCIGTIHLITV